MNDVAAPMSPPVHDPLAAARYAPEKLQKVNLFSSPRMFVDVYGLAPGQAQKTHAHAASDKVYHVLQGRCTVILGEIRHALAAGQTAVAPAGQPHGVENDSAAPVALLVIMAPNPTP